MPMCVGHLARLSTLGFRADIATPTGQIGIQFGKDGHCPQMMIPVILAS